MKKSYVSLLISVVKLELLIKYIKGEIQVKLVPAAAVIQVV